jgi:hypothetical protein
MYKIKISVEQLSEIVSHHDPVLLIADGCPLDEYSGEIKTIYDTISQNEIDELLSPGQLEEALKKIFARSFSAGTVDLNLPAYKAIADDILKLISPENENGVNGDT